MKKFEYQKIISIISKNYPAKGMVDMGNPEDTLLATLLSAQTTDAQVVKIYPGFRAAFPTLSDLAQADAVSIEKPLRSINYFRTKAKHIQALSRILMERFQGKVPKTLEELIQLPGVGRKTASCVLWYGFRIPAMAVDTHVFRIVKRLGWASGKNPIEVERELRESVPSKYWGDINRAFIPFGRDICKARNPECYRCPVATWCPSSLVK